MFTYEVHLQCDGNKCSEQITVSSDSVDISVKQAAQQALRNGWIRKKIKWFCPDCQNESSRSV